jgi:hypothetical protein
MNLRNRLEEAAAMSEPCQQLTFKCEYAGESAWFGFTGVLCKLSEHKEWVSDEIKIQYKACWNYRNPEAVGLCEIRRKAQK